MDKAFSSFDYDENAEDDDTIINVAVIGKPNAGKSSLVNKITNEERCIVSDIAGTTRDTIDTLVENKYGMQDLWQICSGMMLKMRFCSVSRL